MHSITELFLNYVSGFIHASKQYCENVGQTTDIASFSCDNFRSCFRELRPIRLLLGAPFQQIRSKVFGFFFISFPSFNTAAS